MKVRFFNAHRYERDAFEQANIHFRHDIQYLEPRLTEQTASLAAGAEVICSFVSDKLDEAALVELRKAGVRLIALRCAGYNHVDLDAAARLALPVVRVPEYSPYAVAEHGVSLILTLDRKIHRSYTRVREGNFSLDGLVGFDLHGKTIGIIEDRDPAMKTIGVGLIGTAFAAR